MSDIWSAMITGLCSIIALYLKANHKTLQDIQTKLAVYDEKFDAEEERRKDHELRIRALEQKHATQ